MPTSLQRAPREQIAPAFNSPNAPRPGASNWGTGIQPERRTTEELNAQPWHPAPAAPSAAPSGGGRDLGTLSSTGLNRTPNYPLGFDAKPALHPTFRQDTPIGTPNGRGGMNLGSYTSADLGRGANYATRTAATPAYRAPQQTERANPLSGDNNLPMEGQTTQVRPAPFVQRGAAMPAGQDAATPIRQTLTDDADIGASLTGTPNHVGGNGAFSRKFGSPAAANSYSQYVRRLFPQGA